MPFLEVKVGLTVDAAFPVEPCCNCGSLRELAIIPTTLAQRTFLGFGGIEKSVTLPLPYCPDCTRSAARERTGLGGKLLVSLLVSMILMIAYAVIGASTPRPLLPFDSGWAVFGLVFAISAALVFGLYALRRPRGPQTSWSQPVRLVKVRQRFLDGTVVGFVFGFSSSVYRQYLEAANPEGFAQGYLEARDG